MTRIDQIARLQILDLERIYALPSPGDDPLVRLTAENADLRREIAWQRTVGAVLLLVIAALVFAGKGWI